MIITVDQMHDLADQFSQQTDLNDRIHAFATAFFAQSDIAAAQDDGTVKPLAEWHPAEAYGIGLMTGLAAAVAAGADLRIA